MRMDGFKVVARAIHSLARRPHRILPTKKKIIYRNHLVLIIDGNAGYLIVIYK